MDINKAIDKFIDFGVNVKNYSNTTIVNYKIDLNIFNEFCTKNNITDIKDIKRNLVEDYMVYMNKEQGWADSTRRRRLSSLKKFMSYLDQREWIDRAPNLDDLAPRREKKLPTYLNLQESKRLLESPRGFSEHRDRAIIATILYAGLRVSELVNLKIDDIDFVYQRMTINGKGSKQREIPVNYELIKYIQRYLDEERIDSNYEQLFLTKSGQPMYPCDVGRMITKYLKDAGIKKNVTPHTLRHTFATLLYEDNDLLEIKELLGHESVATTQIYAHIASQSKKDVIDNNPLSEG